MMPSGITELERVKRPGRGVDLPHIARSLSKDWSYISATTSGPCMACSRVNVTFTLLLLLFIIIITLQF
jgi:hypothetical protein